MTTNLAIFILGLTLTMFFSSAMARRGGPNAQAWDKARKALAIVVLGFVAYYFYRRFTG